MTSFTTECLSWRTFCPLDVLDWIPLIVMDHLLLCTHCYFGVEKLKQHKCALLAHVKDSVWVDTSSGTAVACYTTRCCPRSTQYTANRCTSHICAARILNACHWEGDMQVLFTATRYRLLSGIPQGLAHRRGTWRHDHARQQRGNRLPSLRTDRNLATLLEHTRNAPSVSGQNRGRNLRSLISRRSSRCAPRVSALLRPPSSLASLLSL